jgi:rod shape-determining protein MreD
MKYRDVRWFVVCFSNLLLWWLVSIANHHLAPHSKYLYVAGIFVVYAALRLTPRQGMAATAVTGLAIDALEPVPFGMHFVLLGLVHATLLYGRRRFPRQEPLFATVVALLANLFVFIAVSFVLIGDNPRPASAWPRLFVDLVLSQFMIAIITPWFIALQERTFELLHISPETGRARQS